MKLSVCIPVYNFYVYPLVERLAKQSAALRQVEVELVCIVNGRLGQSEDYDRAFAKYIVP